MLHGFLNVAKPSGMTSHDVVARVRALIGQRRVGHTGTLDPLAEGVLPLALGRATRLADRVGQGLKVYRAEVVLGAGTATDDAEGEVVARSEAPLLTAAEMDRALDRFRGEIDQVPPSFSAIQVQGKRAYRLARSGEPLALSARRVTIYELRLLDWSIPRATLLVRCSRGTYIRSLARDLGDALGCGGYLSFLVRLAVGPFDLSWALTMEDIRRRATSSELERVVVPSDIAVLDEPAVVVGLDRQADFHHGRPWTAFEAPLQAGAESVRAYLPDGRLLGLMHYDSSDGRWHPRLVLID